MSNQARHGDGGAIARLASLMWERNDGPVASPSSRARYERLMAEREAERRADDAEASLRRSVARLKRRLVEMPCGHTVPSNPLRPDWCSTCERLTGGVE